MEGKLMHKGKLKTDFKGNRSIPDRGTSRPRESFGKTAQTIRAQRARAPCWEQSARVPIMTDRRSVGSGGN